MYINFGDFKVAIHAGITSENAGRIVFHKLFEPINDDPSNYYDSPLVMDFSTVQSVDTVILALKHIRGAMYEEGKR